MKDTVTLCFARATDPKNCILIVICLRDDEYFVIDVWVEAGLVLMA